MKNILIGVGMLILAFYILWEQGKQQQENLEQSRSIDRTSIEDFNGSDRITPFNETNTTLSYTKIDQNLSSFEEINEELSSGLENDFSSLVFTNVSGGVREVNLKKFSRLSRDYNMSHPGEPLLALSFEDETGRKLSDNLSLPKQYKRINMGDERIVYVWELENKFRIERHYFREDNSTYVFDHKTKLTNLSSSPLPLGRVKLNLGSAFRMPRLYNPFDNAATYLNVGYYNAGLPLAEGCSCAECSGRIDGEKEEFFQLNEMGVTGEMETRKLSQVKWACVNNQFFVNIVRPVEDLGNTWINGRSTLKSENDEEIEGVSGTVSFPLAYLPPNSSREFNFKVFAGPKDYAGLAELGHEQKKVMQFGVFWWISEPLSWLLNKLHGLLGSYGFAIIVLTILVKLLLWPLTAKATRSQKKMQSLQKPMSKLREKHKGEFSKTKSGNDEVL